VYGKREETARSELAAYQKGDFIQGDRPEAGADLTTTLVTFDSVILAALRAHGELRARIPHLVASRLPRPYHFRARTQYYQHVAAIFGRLCLAVRSSRAAIPSNRKPRLKKISNQPRRSPPGRSVRAVEGGHGVGSGDPRYVAGQSEERTALALFQKEISLRIFARIPRGRIGVVAESSQNPTLRI
jgi:hypothetical protein